MSNNFKKFLYALSAFLLVAVGIAIDKDIDQHNCTNAAKEFGGTGNLYGKQCIITARTGHKIPLEIR